MIQIHENRQRRRRGAHSAKGEASNAPHLAEAVEHRGNDDMVHHRRVRLRKCEGGRRGREKAARTTVPAPAVRMKCSSPWTSPAW